MSSLYKKQGIAINNIDIVAIQDTILNKVKQYLPDKTNDSEILAELQHFGGDTNWIDFTTDYFIALFFACNKNFDKDGKVILLPKQSNDYEIREPTETIDRVRNQKSIFVESSKGFVIPNITVDIPADLKKHILNYLKKGHSIDTKTIYRDIHGFIASEKPFDDYTIHNLQGINFKENGKFYETLTEYTIAIQLNPNYADAYINRGRLYRELSNIYINVNALDQSIKDFDKAIEIIPNKPEYIEEKSLSELKLQEGGTP